MIKKKLMPTKTVTKKFFSVQEADARLPLLRSILRDVTDLSAEMKGLHERLILLQTSGKLDPVLEKEMNGLIGELDRRQELMTSYQREILQLGAELKDSFVGLVDFPAMHDGREVCLCWKLGEPAVAHWHECDAGFAGRRPVTASFGKWEIA